MFTGQIPFAVAHPTVIADWVLLCSVYITRRHHCGSISNAGCCDRCCRSVVCLSVCLCASLSTCCIRAPC